MTDLFGLDCKLFITVPGLVGRFGLACYVRALVVWLWFDCLAVVCGRLLVFCGSIWCLVLDCGGVCSVG